MMKDKKKKKLNKKIVKKQPRLSTKKKAAKRIKLDPYLDIADEIIFNNDEAKELMNLRITERLVNSGLLFEFLNFTEGSFEELKEHLCKVCSLPQDSDFGCFYDRLDALLQNTVFISSDDACYSNIFKY